MRFSLPRVYLNIISTEQYLAERQSFFFVEKLVVANPSEQILLLLFLRKEPRQIPNNPSIFSEKHSAQTGG
jgi:hypothetical protein